MPIMSLDDHQNHDWTKTGWIDEPCAEDVTELLLNDDINEVVEYDEYEYDTGSDEELWGILTYPNNCK